eukprot:767018-Amphidinium_carterae.1
MADRCSWYFCGESRSPYNCLLSRHSVSVLLSCSHSGGGLTRIVVSGGTGVLRKADAMSDM